MEQDELLRFAIALLERLQVPYMLVGSLASGVYGEPRLTQDIDIVIAPTSDQLDQICAAFPPADFYLSREAAHEALLRRDQFNVLDPASGNKIGFMIAKSDAWGIEQLSRRQRVQVMPNQHGYAARPEDVIISKMRYYEEGGSEKHLRDITGMLKASAEHIDREYIAHWAAKFAVSEIWQAILARLGE